MLIAQLRTATLARSACGLVTVCLLALHFGAARAQTAPTFAVDVAPILRERCIVCHQGEAAPLGLRLDSYADAMKGSQKGPVIKPGDAHASELAKRVRGESQPRMPLTGPPWLAAEQIALIERWIASGAPEGAGAPAAAPARVRQPGDPVTYADVAPILVGRCAKCHSASGIMGAPPEGFRLDTLAATLDASDRVRVVPGNASGSELVRRIRGQARPRMPFDGPPYLEEAQIALVEQWIAQGARDAQGTPARIPVGARVRLHGKLAGASMLDDLPLRGQARRIDRRTGVGDYVELRGTVAPDGGIVPERIRSR